MVVKTKKNFSLGDEEVAVYKTGKMHVDITPDTVIKTFLPQRSSARRFQLEVKALSLLSQLKQTPELIDVNDAQLRFSMTRLPGHSPKHLSCYHLQQLTDIFDEVIASGVARHSLPLRDLLIDNNDRVYVVDFERVTLRGNPYSPIWLIATWVTRYHLLRLKLRHQPSMLTTRQQGLLSALHFVRYALKPIGKLTRYIKKDLLRLT
ncbi:MAG: hypothetical protein ACPGUD_10920 [Parashewanella sp.]